MVYTHSLNYFILPIRTHNRHYTHLSRELALEGLLESDSVSGELADTLTELLDGHLLLVEVEAESSLVVDVGLLLDVGGSGRGGVELLGDVLGAVEELLEQVGL